VAVADAANTHPVGVAELMEHQMGEQSYVLVSHGREFDMTIKDRGGFGSFVTCAELPGFSYMLAPGENPNVMLPTLEKFVAVNSEWLASQQRT
jgi:hypothetical protein